MKSKAFPWAVQIVAVLILAGGTGAVGQTPNNMEFAG